MKTLYQLGNLFNSTDYCDIKLKVEDKIFEAHKIVLAARSEYFRALLYSGMRETNCDFVEINEAKPDAFKLLLRYIYTGKISLSNEKEESVIDLLSLVHQYGLIELQRSISDYLESILEIKNVCSIYDISSLYQLESLQETSARFIDKNCAVLVKQNAFISLSCVSSKSSRIHYGTIFFIFFMNFQDLEYFHFFSQAKVKISKNTFKVFSQLRIILLCLQINWCKSDYIWSPKLIFFCMKKSKLLHFWNHFGWLS